MLVLSVALATLSANPTTIQAVLNKAKPGDRIVLTKASYPTVKFPSKTWAPQPLFVDASRAQIVSIVAHRVSGVIISGGAISGPDTYGIGLRDSSRISILNMDISNVWRGIVVGPATDVLIRGNNLHALRVDGIDVIGQRIVIDRNTIRDFKPIEGDHPDGIQLWSVKIPTEDVRIVGNTITGKMQGIFGRTPGIGLVRIFVQGNVVRNSYPNGIVLMDATDSVVTGNDVRWLGDKPGKSNMRVEGARNRACGNTVFDVPKALVAGRC